MNAWRIRSLKIHIRTEIDKIDKDFGQKIPSLFMGWYLNWYSKNPDQYPSENNLFSDIILSSDVKYFYGGYIPDKMKKLLDRKIGKYKITRMGDIKIYRISERQKKRLKNIYIGNDYRKDSNTLLRFYSVLGGINNNSAIPPSILPKNSFELFGSPLNTSFEYCSLLTIEKDLFSSNGSFFDYIPRDKDKIYICNPPFENAIMEKTMRRIIKHYGNFKVIITIPVWDSKTQKELGIQDNGNDYKTLDILKESGMTSYIKILPKYEYKFYNYYLDKYLPLSYTYFICIGNIPEKSEILKEWRNISSKSKDSPLHGILRNNNV